VGDCGKEQIAKAILSILKVSGPLTSVEIIKRIRLTTGCSDDPVVVREVLAQLVRTGAVTKVPVTDKNKNMFVFRLRR